MTDNVKNIPFFSFIRLGKAAYGMRKWEKSIEHFEASLALCTTSDDDVQCAERIRKELVRAKDRHAESTTGKYDIAMLVETCIRSSQVNFDLADFKGLHFLYEFLPNHFMKFHTKGL
jgi:hypothetical protein